MKIQAVYKIEHDDENFFANEQELRNAIPQIKAVIKVFDIVREAGASIEEAGFNILALESTNEDIYFRLYSEGEAKELLAAINEALGVSE